MQTDIRRSGSGINNVITFQPSGPRMIDVPFTIMNDTVSLEALESHTVQLNTTIPQVTLGNIPTSAVEIQDDDG